MAMKNTFILTALVLAMPCGFIPSSFAETLIEIGIHSGGDEITLLSDSNDIIESTKAGSLYTFAIGGMKPFTDKLEGQFSFGIKSNSNLTSDNEASWIRYPLNAMLFYRTENLRLGLGATAHFSPKFEVSGTTKNASNTYKDALGALLEVDFRISQNFHWGLRYTNIKYVSESDNTRFDGSSFGLLLIALL